MLDRIGISRDEIMAIIHDELLGKPANDGSNAASVIGAAMFAVVEIVEANNAKLLEDIKALIAQTRRDGL